LSAWVLDTGALVALQRDRPRLLALLEAADQLGLRLRAPAPILTEFLGRSPRSLRRAADHMASHLEIGTVDELLARRAAQLQRRALDAGGRGDPSAIDAIVAADAEAVEGWLIHDGDRLDLQALADASGSVELRQLRELA
jgi:predicted nucleic acid-binding protein